MVRSDLDRTCFLARAWVCLDSGNSSLITLEFASVETMRKNRKQKEHDVVQRLVLTSACSRRGRRNCMAQAFWGSRTLEEFLAGTCSIFSTTRSTKWFTT